VKDLSEVHMADPAGFLARFDAARARAEDLFEAAPELVEVLLGGGHEERLVEAVGAVGRGRAAAVVDLDLELIAVRLHLAAEFDEVAGGEPLAERRRVRPGLAGDRPRGVSELEVFRMEAGQWWGPDVPVTGHS